MALNFILINVFIIISHYLLLTRLRVERLSEKLLLIGLFVSAQIILTETLLGALKLLFVVPLVILNLGLACCFAAYGLRRSRVGLGRESNWVSFSISADWQSLKQFYRETFFWENKILLGLALFATGWILAATYFFPTRGCDDSFYHLPVIYQMIASGRIELLPVDIRAHFAFPFNADLLFAWPAIIFQSARWVDGVQLLYAWATVLATYCILTHYGHNRRIAFFLGVLFFLTPVVLMQSGTNLIEVIMAFFFTAGFYFCFKYYQKPRLLHLIAGATSAGLLAGAKYPALPLVLGMCAAFFVKMIRVRRKSIFLFFVIMAVSGGFWYVRNYLVLGSPVYPYLSGENFGQYSSLTVLDPGKIKVGMDAKIVSLFLHDPGLGTFQGGFGPVFWGMAFPAWLFCFFQCARRKSGKEFIFLVYLLFAVVGICLILLQPESQIEFSMRYIIFIIPIGLLALAEVLGQIIKSRFIIRNCVFALCISFSALSVCMMASTIWPYYNLKIVFKDLAKGLKHEEFKYLKKFPWYLRYYGYHWELIDDLTRDTGGLSCYYTAPQYSYWLAHLYGSRLQNRIWNFEESPRSKPDIYFSVQVPDQENVYAGYKITLDQVVNDHDYVPILLLEQRYLYIKRSELARFGRTQVLLDYYEKNFPKLLALINSELGAELNAQIPIVAEGDWGVIIQYLKLTGQIRNEFYWLPNDSIGQFVEGRKMKVIYTMNSKCLSSCVSDTIWENKGEDIEVKLYRNEISQ